VIGTALSGELSSEHIVGQMENNILLRAERYLSEVNEPPMLSIIAGNSDHGPSKTYMGLKQKVGERLGIQVNVYDELGSITSILDRIEADNNNPSVHGIIVQLPLRPGDLSRTDEVLAAVDQAKDVDGLAPDSPFTPATVAATESWLEGQGIDCVEERMALIGLGRLVNGPFYTRLMQRGALAVRGFDKQSNPLEIIEGLNEARVIVSATGHPGLLTPELFLPDAGHKVLVDVGTAEQSGAQQGDVSDELRAYALEQGWALTPRKRGIGLITVRELLRNVLDAAESQAGITEPINQYRVRQSLAATSSWRSATAFDVERDEPIPIDS